MTAGFLITAIQSYLGIGFVVAVIFLIIGIERIDPSGRANYTFRPLLVPGLTLLWPLVIWRWVYWEKNPEESGDTH